MHIEFGQAINMDINYGERREMAGEVGRISINFMDCN